MNGSRTRLGKNHKLSGNKSQQTHNNPKPMGHSKGSPEREVHSDTCLPKIDTTFQMNNLTLHLQKLDEQQQTKPRANRRKEITKIRAEFNDIEIKKKLKGSYNPGAGSVKR